MHDPYQPNHDVHVLPTSLAIPGMGNLVVNAFVLLAREPVLVDAGIAVEASAFVEGLRSVMDPAELRWIWLTHDDADHTGALAEVLALAPRARLVTHGLAALRLSTWCRLALDRVYAVRPGDVLDCGDRRLHALRPPVFDNPTSIGALDDRSRTLFAVDAFGAILPDTPDDASEIPEDDLLGGMTAWTTFDAPWAHLVDRARFDRAIDELTALEPSTICTSHLPAAAGASIGTFAKVVKSVPDAEPFAAPDHEAFAAIAAAMAALV